MFIIIIANYITVHSSPASRWACWPSSPPSPPSSSQALKPSAPQPASIILFILAAIFRDKKCINLTNWHTCTLSHRNTTYLLSQNQQCSKFEQYSSHLLDLKRECFHVSLVIPFCPGKNHIVVIISHQNFQHLLSFAKLILSCSLRSVKVGDVTNVSAPAALSLSQSTPSGADGWESSFFILQIFNDTSAVFVTDVKKNDEKRNGVNGTSLLRAILSGSEATPRTLSWVSWLAMMHYSWGSWFIQLGFRATLFHSHPIPFCNWGTQQGAWGWQTSQGTDGRRCDRKATTLAAKLSWLLTPTHSQFRTRS